jgi:putative transposase
MMCRVLDISRSGFHAWMKRPLSGRAIRDAQLLAEIRVSHARSDETYGAPRILGDLQDLGHWVGQKRIARLMQANAIRGVSRRRGTITTRRGPDETAASDLVQRAFTAEAPNQL